jgi:hypothetical protein
VNPSSSGSRMETNSANSEPVGFILRALYRISFHYLASCFKRSLGGRRGRL